jgi:hypothetical protein
MKIFIGATQSDLDLAQDLGRRLKAIGLKTFIDEEIEEPGKELVRLLQRHLRSSDEAIFLLTQNAITSEKIIFEIGAALSLRKKITPVVVGVEADNLPPIIKHLPYISLFKVESLQKKQRFFQRIEKPN